MSGEGAPGVAVGDAHGLKVGIVVAQWHSTITDALLAGARRACQDAGVDEPEVLVVPGAFELAIGAQALARDCDAVVALGVVIRGGTPHFEYVCGAATDGLNRVALDAGVPVGFGLLTCDTEAQARERSGLPGSCEDKGHEAASAALATAALLRRRSL